MAKLTSRITLCNNCGHSFDIQVPSLPLDVAGYLRAGRQINSELEEETYSETLSALRKKISECNLEISNLKDIVKNLEDGRQLIRNSILRKVQSLVAPIRRLPLEILEIIFGYVCISVHGHNATRLAYRGPFALSSVCIYWRDICLSSPRLWTSIFANANNSDLLPRFKNVLKLVQERSRQLPLHLDVSARCSPPNLFLNIPQLRYHGLDSLFYGKGILHLRRLMSLSMHFNTNSGTLSLQNNHGEFPELEHLKLSGVFVVSYPDEPLIDLFAHAPKLHTLSLDSFSGIVHFRLPDEQITIVHYSDYRSQNISILQCKRFPNATTATFHRCGLDLSYTSDLPFRKLLLEDVILHGNPISQKTIPYLTSLELVSTDQEVDRITYHAGVIRSLIQHVSRSLTELTLTTVDFTSTDALSILRMTPNIVRLSIVEQNQIRRGLIASDFIEGLVDRRMLPKLQHLQLVWSGDVDEAAVMDMVEHRAFMSVVIGVRMGGELRWDTWSRVNVLRKRGTTITLW
ncbi:hypothetical protein EV421DRAFT_2025027 [Armillaria borealis]|uniref:F-box domain-containing protein n=1 Tax=Armillaria borealis TaxID=47425 RepID=A0AA39IVC8_9AGAR|nr:hypothetical protein EV421DRAFT_2025027 [Armillaria borealis]